MCLYKIKKISLLPLLLAAAVSLSCSNLDKDLNDAFNSEGIKYFAYAASSLSDKIIIYNMDPVTGKLTLNGSTAINNPAALTTDPSGRYLYALSSDDNSVTAYSRGDDGELTTAGVPASTGTGPASIIVTQTGEFLYVLNKSGLTISSFSIDPSTGALSLIPGGSIATGSDPRKISVDPSDKWLYTANYGDNNITGYKIDSLTGGLSANSGNPLLSANHPSSIAITPSGLFAYVANWGTAYNSPSSISVCSIDSSTGTLNEIQNITVSNILNLCEITMHPSGKYLFAATEFNDTSVIAYSIGSDGKLTLINEVDTGSGNGISSITVDQSGKFLFITNNWQNKITILSISSTGALTFSEMVTVSGATSIVFTTR